MKTYEFSTPYGPLWIAGKIPKKQLPRVQAYISAFPWTEKNYNLFSHKQPGEVWDKTFEDGLDRIINAHLFRQPNG